MREMLRLDISKTRFLFHATFVVMIGLSLSASSLSHFLVDLKVECQELAEKGEKESEEKKDSKEKMGTDDFIPQSIKYTFYHLKLGSAIDLIGDSWITPCVSFPTPPPEQLSYA